MDQPLHDNPRSQADEVALRGLVSRVAQGQEAALTELYRETSPRVFGLAVRILKDRHMAEEAVLDVYTQLWERAATAYDPSRGRLLPWLLMLTRSRALDRLRDRGFKMNVEDIAQLATELRTDVPGPAETTNTADTAKQVRQAIGQLPRGQREAIAAAFFGGMSHQQIARSLDVPLGTVKTRIRSGMITLRRALAGIDRGL